MDGGFWKRAGLALRDVCLPIRGAVAVVAQALGWAVVIFGAGWAAVTWTDLLPPSVRGKLFLVGLMLLLVFMGVQAAYRLRKQLEVADQARRNERSAERRRICVNIHQLLQDFRWLQDAVLGRDPADVHLAVRSLKASLAEYTESSKAPTVNIRDSAKHTRIQTEMRRALGTERVSGKALAERLWPPVLEAFGYATVFGADGTLLDQDELEKLDRWLKGAEGLRELLSPPADPPSSKA